MIYHITRRAVWREAMDRGQYMPPGLAAEGFIHCSTADQVVPVARKFYGSETGLVLLEIDPAKLSAAIRWEAPADGTLPAGVPATSKFPHVYGPINIDAVVQVLGFEPDERGEFALPKEVSGPSQTARTPKS